MQPRARHHGIAGIHDRSWQCGICNLQYLKGLTEFESHPLRHSLRDGEHCVALLNLDTIYGTIPFAKHIQVVNREIVFVRGYCDPRPMFSATNVEEQDK